MQRPRIAIVGSAGIPARYGGFETLAEQLVRRLGDRVDFTVYCSREGKNDSPSSYLGANLSFVNFMANGWQSILYDVTSLWRARSSHDAILVLGVSGAIAMPLLRAMGTARMIVNIDGLEWKRTKWDWKARWFLRLSEMLAVRFSDSVIADNPEIAAYIRDQYDIQAVEIPYGGDHAAGLIDDPPRTILPSPYILGLCRIEPENNVHEILTAFAVRSDCNLVFVGNWEHSPYARQLKQRFGEFANIHLFGPNYDPGFLAYIRNGASAYVHGHSAGGTNPSLIEAMTFGLPCLCFDVRYNRATTENAALYWGSQDDLIQLISQFKTSVQSETGAIMAAIASRRYTWQIVAEKYYELFRRENKS